MSTRFASTLLLSTAATFALAAAGTAAFADEAGATSTGSSSKMRASAQIEMLPVGELEAGVEGESFSTDTATAYGISAAFDYAVTPFLSIGVSPRLVLNVDSDESDEDSDPGKQLDLRARVLAHMPMAPKLEVYGYLSPGYSIAMFDDEELDDPTGFSLGGALGASYDVSSAMYLTGEVGYTKAFTSTDVMVGPGQSVEADLDLSYLHVGLGAGTRF